MSCGHGWHGCGPWYGPPDELPYGRGYYGPASWHEDAGWPARGWSRRGRRVDPELAAEELATRLEDLRDEIRRVEAELAHLSRPAAAPGEDAMGR